MKIQGTLCCKKRRTRFRAFRAPAHHFRPELLDVFLTLGNPGRIFERDAQGPVTAFVDPREARDIVWQRID